VELEVPLATPPPLQNGTVKDVKPCSGVDVHSCTVWRYVPPSHRLQCYQDYMPSQNRKWQFSQSSLRESQMWRTAPCQLFIQYMCGYPPSTTTCQLLGKTQYRSDHYSVLDGLLYLQLGQQLCHWVLRSSLSPSLCALCNSLAWQHLSSHLLIQQLKIIHHGKY
jgi:hypothetical protein